MNLSLRIVIRIYGRLKRNTPFSHHTSRRRPQENAMAGKNAYALCIGSDEQHRKSESVSTHARITDSIDACGRCGNRWSSLTHLWPRKRSTNAREYISMSVLSFTTQVVHETDEARASVHWFMRTRKRRFDRATHVDETHFTQPTIGNYARENCVSVGIEDIDTARSQ